VGQFDDGHFINFHSGKWKVSIEARILAQGCKTCTLYMTTNIRDTVAAVDVSVNSKLWQLRLGHMSEKGMKVLLSKGKLPKLKSVESDICEGCILGKQKKVSFVKVGKAPKPEKLELVHADLWGPFLVASLGGSRYYVTFIDDSSRKVWVYFLKLKSDVRAPTIGVIRALIRNHHPDLLFLSKTKVISSRFQATLIGLGFVTKLEFPLIGSRGGIFLTWKIGFDIEHVKLDCNAISCMVKLEPPTTPWFFSCIYAPNKMHESSIFGLK